MMLSVSLLIWCLYLTLPFLCLVEQLDRGSTDFHSFLSLQWPIALQQPHSLVRLVVKDAHRRVLGTCDLRPLPFWTVPPDERGLREVSIP